MSVRDTAFEPCSEEVYDKFEAPPRTRDDSYGHKFPWCFHPLRGAGKEALHPSPGEIKFFKKTLDNKGVVHGS